MISWHLSFFKVWKFFFPAYKVTYFWLLDFFKNFPVVSSRSLVSDRNPMSDPSGPALGNDTGFIWLPSTLDLVHRQRTAVSGGSFSQGLSPPPSRPATFLGRPALCAWAPPFIGGPWPRPLSGASAETPLWGGQGEEVGGLEDAFLHHDSVTREFSSWSFPSPFFCPLFRALWAVGFDVEVF